MPGTSLSPPIMADPAVGAQQEVNAHNEQTALVTEMWSNYMRNVRFNLEAQGTLQQPQ